MALGQRTGSAWRAAPFVDGLLVVTPANVKWHVERESSTPGHLANH